MSTLSLRGRVYSLDALRAIMMLLGLVIHTVITYSPIGYPGVWDLKAKNTNVVFELTLNWIHIFRMPVFFVAAGFFGALLFYKKGPWLMLKNRINRILLPLLVSLLILWPMVVFTFTFSMQAIAGNADALEVAYNSILNGNFIPYKLAHLWFLYNLIIFSVFCWAVAMIIPGSNVISRLFIKVNDQILARPILRIAVLFLVFFSCLFFNGTYYLETNTSFALHFNLIFNYLVFYSLGWMIYRCEKLEQMNWQPVPQLILATVLFSISMYLDQTFIPGSFLPAKQVLMSLSGTLYVFGFLAFFVRYFPSYSPTLSYIMESAYFVYLIHLPIAAFIPGLLAGAGLPLSVEYLIVLAGTVLLSFLMYHYLARNTFVGKFLNGKVFRQLQNHPPATHEKEVQPA